MLIFFHVIYENHEIEKKCEERLEDELAVVGRP